MFRMVEKMRSNHHLKSGGNALGPYCSAFASRRYRLYEGQSPEIGRVIEFLHTATCLPYDVVGHSDIARGPQHRQRQVGHATQALLG